MSHHDSILPEAGQEPLARVLAAISSQDRFRRAIEVCGRFGHVERSVVHFVFDRGWVQPYYHGCKRSLPVPLSCSALESLGVHKRTDLQHAIRRLADQKIIVRQDGGGYLLNRDYRAWLDRDGEPRIRPACYEFVESGRLPHECPPVKPSLAVVGEFPEGETSDLSTPHADATETILDDSRGCASESTLPAPDVLPEAHPDGSDVLPEAHPDSDHQNGSIERGRAPRYVLGRERDDLQSYSSTHSLRNGESFSSDVCVSFLEKGSSAHQQINGSTHTHTKKKNLWGAPSQNGVKSACMESQPAANPTVEADRDSRNMNLPAAPSIKERSPTTMLQAVAGPIEPDVAHWADLEHICSLYCPDMIWNFRSYRFTFPTDVMVGALKRCLLREFDKVRSGPDQSISVSFSYVRSIMSNWKGPEGESRYDRDMKLIPVESTGPGPSAPAAESTNADPYADLMANSPGMFGEWFKDHHVSMNNNPPYKGKPNGKLMDDEDFNRRMAIKARDPDRFVKLSMAYYCPSLILERESCPT